MGIAIRNSYSDCVTAVCSAATRPAAAPASDHSQLSRTMVYKIIICRSILPRTSEQFKIHLEGWRIFSIYLKLYLRWLGESTDKYWLKSWLNTFWAHCSVKCVPASHYKNYYKTIIAIASVVCTAVGWVKLAGRPSSWNLPGDLATVSVLLNRRKA